MVRQLVLHAALLAVALFTAPARAQTTPESSVPVTNVSISQNGPKARYALRQIEQQTGINVRIMDPYYLIGDLDDAPLNFEAHAQPLWSVLQPILTKASKSDTCAWYMSDGHTTWLIGGYLSVAGPFLVTARAITHEVDYRRGDSEAERFQVQLQVAIDPAVRISMMSSTPRIEKATDELGNPFVLAGDGSNLQSGPRQVVVNQLVCNSYPVVFRAPPKLGRKLQHFQGAIPATRTTKTESVELSAPGTIVKDYGDLHVEYSWSAGSTPSDSVVLSATFTCSPGMPIEQWLRQRQQYQSTRMTLFDAAGKSWTVVFGVRPIGQGLGADQFRTATTFTKGLAGTVPAGEATRAVIEIPLEVAPIDIPFHFEGLPLR